MPDTGSRPMPGDLRFTDEDHDSKPRCYHGGGAAEHAWMVITPTYDDVAGTHSQYIGCRDCPAVLSLQTLLDEHEELGRMVKSGLAVLLGELETHRKDLVDASTEYRVPAPEPGSDMAKIMRENRLTARRLSHARAALLSMYNAAHSHPGSATGDEAQKYTDRLKEIMLWESIES